MILKIYAIYDMDAETFNERTFMAPNDKVAMRMMGNTLNSDKQFNDNASHYELHCCGTYNTESGGIESILDTEKMPTTRKVCDIKEIEPAKRES